ncbi:MAG: efflux RND transporter periplasmic adaptor subunit [Pseudomonadota bacterium]
MNSQNPKDKGLRLIYVAGGLLALVLIVLYSAGAFTTGKIGPGTPPPTASPAPAQEGALLAELTRVPQYYEAVGTVRPLSQATVAAQVPGRVLQVLARAGQAVQKGQLLARLEDQQFQARLAQARQGLAGAEANLERAGAEYERVKKFAQAEAATPQNLEQARAAFLGAQAGLGQARQQVREAEVALGHTQLLAPENGQVVQRLIEPGDLALPGKPLFSLQTVGGHRLEALVREGLIAKVKVGGQVKVEIPSLGRAVAGQVDEVAPSADPATRSFMVKVGLAATPGLHAGMFGRLMVPLEERPAVLVPRQALRRVGQLEMVRLLTAQGWQSVYVTTGREMDGKVEVLSGLKGGETLKAEGGGDES